MSRAATDNESHLSKALRIGEHFVRAIRLMPFVQQVILETGSTGTRIWTVLDAEPWDRSVREMVYQAELAVLSAHPEAEVDFRLINLAEYEDMPIEEILPSPSQILWRRPSAA